MRIEKIIRSSLTITILLISVLALHSLLPSPYAYAEYKFIVSASERYLHITPGGSAIVDVAVYPLESETEEVILLWLPDFGGADIMYYTESVNMEPLRGTPPFSAVGTIVISQETPLGEYSTLIFADHGSADIPYTQVTLIVEEEKPPPDPGGGCLIATATYGSELAPQVQMLREIRDNSLLQTQSGQSFMQGFNEFYYSFSPTIADWERQNPVFKEAVKLAITPLITTLSILQYVDIDSEEEMLGYGIGIISLNVGMYFSVPAFVIIRVRKLFR